MQHIMVCTIGNIMLNVSGYYLNIIDFFFFKQKTAYEMRISDWSSDVCSSDLRDRSRAQAAPVRLAQEDGARAVQAVHLRASGRQGSEIGRASCRERVCQYV